jgi:hypothetical protein
MIEDQWACGRNPHFSRKGRARNGAPGGAFLLFFKYSAGVDFRVGVGYSTDTFRGWDGGTIYWGSSSWNGQHLLLRKFA